MFGSSSAGLAAAMALLLGGCASGASGGGSDSAAAVKTVPRALTWSTYDDVKRLVSLRSHERTYQSVPWRRTVAEGLRAAQTQDKPLLLWLYFGGPRGAC